MELAPDSVPSGLSVHFWSNMAALDCMALEKDQYASLVFSALFGRPNIVGMEYTDVGMTFDGEFVVDAEEILNL